MDANSNLLSEKRSHQLAPRFGTCVLDPSSTTVATHTNISNKLKAEEKLQRKLGCNYGKFKGCPKPEHECLNEKQPTARFAWFWG